MIQGREEQDHGGSDGEGDLYLILGWEDQDPGGGDGEGDLHGGYYT